MGFVYTILMIALMTIIHEFGHFITAKLFKIKVLEFAVGMGPAIIKHQGKETLYSLRLLPVGGYCKMDGEEELSDNPRAFCRAKVWKRLIVVSAGAFMNLLLGFIAVIITITAFYNLVPTSKIAKFTEMTVQGEKLAPVSNSEGGLEVGDTVLSINGSSVLVTSDIDYILGLCQDESVTVTVDRNGQKLTLENVRFHQVESQGMKGLLSDFGVYGVKKDFFSVISYSARETVGSVRLVFRSLGSLITGKVPISSVSGIIGVGDAVEQTVSQASGVKDIIFMLLRYLALISVNLGVMNLLPFPALDGGHIVFLAYEAIRRKPVPQKLYMILNTVGFALLLTLIAVITVKDIIQLII